MGETRRDGLSALFGQYRESVSVEGDGGGKFAIVLYEDEDGDYAIIKVYPDGSFKVLGFVAGEENAEEFAETLRLIANDGCRCMFDAGKDLMGAVMGKMKGEGE